MNGREIVDAVVNEGGFDTSSTGLSRSTVVGWVSARYRDLVVRSKWRMAIQPIASTVAGQANYLLPDEIAEVDELKVGGARYSQVGVAEMWDIDSALVALGPGYVGVFAPTYDAQGATSLRLHPVPGSAGEAIEALVVLPPAPFADDPSFVPAIPEDFHRRLVDGAIAEGLAKIDERLAEAGVYEDRWEVTVAELRRRKVSRVAQPVTSLRVSRRPR